jgi:hypothetical protein
VSQRTDFSFHLSTIPSVLAAAASISPATTITPGCHHVLAIGASGE